MRLTFVFKRRSSSCTAPCAELVRDGSADEIVDAPDVCACSRVCVCVCVCERARVRASVRACAFVRVAKGDGVKKRISAAPRLYANDIQHLAV